MIKESDARMAVAATAAAAPVAATQPPKRSITEDDDTIGEVPPELMNITLCFAGLPREQIVRIFHS